jgi:hypothetical protein
MQLEPGGGRKLLRTGMSALRWQYPDAPVEAWGRVGVSAMCARSPRRRDADNPFRVLQRIL